MARENKWAKAVKDKQQNDEFRNMLTEDQKMTYDSLPINQQTAYKVQYLNRLKQLEESQKQTENDQEETPVVEPVIEKPVIEPVIEEQKTADNTVVIRPHIEQYDHSIRSIQDLVKSSIPQKEAGKQVSIYLSKEALDILAKYCSKNKIKNKSSLIDTMIKNVLK